MTLRRKTLLAFAASLALQGIVSAFYIGSRGAGPGFASHGVPLDDVWIHFVYARSIAHGQPFQYNPGEWETGATSPLWALVLAPAATLGISLVAAAKAIGILLAACGATVGFRIATRLRDERAGWVFAGALALTPYFSFAAVSGTEVALFVLLLLGALAAALAARWRAAGILTGLAVLARPEGYVLLPLLLVAGLIAPGSRGARARRGITVLVPFAIVIAPWILYCLAATGRPLSASFYVKSYWYGLLNFGQLRKIGALLVSQPFLGEGLGIPALIAIAAIIAAAVLAFGFRRLARAGTPAWILIGLAGPILLYSVSIGHPLGALKAPDKPGSTLDFYIARYLLPGIAPLLLVWAIGLSEIARWRRAAALLVILLPIACTIHQHIVLTDIYSWNCRNIEEQQVAAARWIAANVPTGATVGVSDAGAIRYFGEHRVIDLVGLNTHRLIGFLRLLAAAPKESPREARLRAQFWSDRPPEYLAVTAGWHQALLRGVRAELLKSFALERNTICGGAELVVARPAPSPAPTPAAPNP